jgi:hypothetical protein
MLRYVRYIYNDNNAAQIACQIFCRVFYKRLISHIIYYYLRSHKLHVSVFFFTNNYDGSRSSIDCTFSSIAIFDVIANGS